MPTTYQITSKLGSERVKSAIASTAATCLLKPQARSQTNAKLVPNLLKSVIFNSVNPEQRFQVCQNYQRVN
ncbi:MAG: hypothetical protein EAZ90_11495 [Oscillatoriales cyanobacterium]|nr:MAG: hypothetical protein EAZ90_11495 [Oscillatoriales cyanobacterium]TAF89853.1 MAG: hypothetical protein EAZ49_10940 [Oscillatoriales cyanobacterium]